MRKTTSHKSIEQIVVGSDREARRRARRDVVVTEEPLEIRVLPAQLRTPITPSAATSESAAEHAAHHGSVAAGHALSVTMRTPGHDFELAAGFLYTESLIDAREDIDAMRYCIDPAGDGGQQYNIVSVRLAPHVGFDPLAIQRNFYATSSCGVCGKASIDAVRAAGCPVVRGDGQVTVEAVLALPAKLRAAQAVFEMTGGLHAAALFTIDADLLMLREDVGRHNALDKLVGAMLLAGELPLSDRVAMVSGRLSFELVQKAGRAGITILAGVSAPSSLAVELAENVGMTLIGFLRAERFNVYARGERVAVRPAALRARR